MFKSFDKIEKDGALRAVYEKERLDQNNFGI